MSDRLLDTAFPPFSRNAPAIAAAPVSDHKDSIMLAEMIVSAPSILSRNTRLNRKMTHTLLR